MERLYSYSVTKNFRDARALRIFVRDATKVASQMVSRISSGESETLSLFVNRETGHIRLWCRERDVTASVLETRDDTRYRRIPWQVRGGGLPERPAYESKIVETPF